MDSKHYQISLVNYEGGLLGLSTTQTEDDSWLNEDAFDTEVAFRASEG
jgi:hypothetical protein